MIEMEQDLKKHEINFIGPTDTLRKGRQVFRHKKSGSSCFHNRTASGIKR